MPIYVNFPTSPALIRRLDEIRANTRPGGRVMSRAQGDLREIVVADHAEMMLRGVTRYGADRVPLAPATLADPRRGSGPSLIPRGMASRFITNYEAVWTSAGGSASTLTMRYRDLPFAIYHEQGASRGNWRLPARPTQGISPAGWVKIKQRMERLAGEVLRGG